MIIVLGIGRCGTSTIARLLHTKLNISMGTRFREPDASNPKGFYEDLDFRDLNHTVLNNQMGIDNFQKRIDNLVRNRIIGQSILEQSKLWGIKDPRIGHLWQTYRKYPATYIVCTRRPQLIVKSLMANYNWSEVECKQLIATRLNGIRLLLEGRDALRIDFSHKRTDTELIHLLQKYLT